jgi:hypothetical protein
MVSVVVATDVHHQGLALEVRHFHARGQHRIGGHALGINGETWQIAQVAIAPWGAVFLGVGRVEVTAGGACRDGLAVWPGVRSLSSGVNTTPYWVSLIFTVPMLAPSPLSVAIFSVTDMSAALAEAHTAPNRTALIHCLFMVHSLAKFRDI